MNEKITKARKQNMKIYALYRAVSLDLIFYYAIEFIFITQVKNIHPSDFVLSTSFFAVMIVILQIPASMIVNKLGTRKCTIVANIFNFIFVVLIMCCNNLGMLFIAQTFSAMCYSIKDISDPTLLRFSIPHSKKKGEIFSKIEGEGYKNYNYINAATSIASGFLYMVNPYIPMIGSCLFTLLAIFISFGFQEIEIDTQEEQEELPKEPLKERLKNLIDGLSFIINSQRLRSLFLYSGIMWGIFCVISTLRDSLLVDFGAPAYVITLVTAIVGIASAKGSKLQLRFHKKHRNKSLSIMLILTLFGILVAGLTGIIKPPFIIAVIIIALCFIITNFVKGLYNVLVTRYLGNFSTPEILTQIMAINGMSRNVFRAIICSLGSYLLKVTNTANALIIIGIIFGIAGMGLISYMKLRLGLKPEQYDENEIYNKRNI